MTEVNSTISVITISVNVLNYPVNKQTGRMDFFFKMSQLYAVYSHSIQTHEQVDSEEMERDIPRQ